MGSKKRPLPKELSALYTTKGGGCGRRRLSICTSHSSKSSSSSSSPFDRLTDDLLTEILLRVPIKPLYRSKCVSKRWLSFISSTCFARSYILTRHHNNMLLFEVTHSGLDNRVYALPLFPGAAYPHVSSIPVNFSFVLPLLRDIYNINNYDEDDIWEVTKNKMLQRVFLFGCYGGLVLLYTCIPNHHPENNEYFYYQYYLCNPVSKQWVQLPLIPTFNVVGFTCYYSQQSRGQDGISRIWADTDSYEDIIRNNADYDPNQIDFSVVSIKWDEEKDEFIASVLSSTDETAEWRIFHFPCPPRWMSMDFGTAKLVFLNGKFHWCGTNCIAAYDPFNKPLDCDIIPLPPMDHVESETRERILYLEACEGRLRLVRAFRSGRFRLWDLVDYANKVWVQEVDVVDSTDLMFQSFVGVADRDKVYMVAYPSSVKLFDVRNESVQHFYDPTNSDNVFQLRFVTPFFSSSWPTPIAVQQKKLLSYIDFH